MDTVNDMKDFMNLLKEYLDNIKQASDDDFNKNYPRLDKPTFTFTKGGRFIKIIREQESSRSVFCFVDKETLDIYKAASWKTPQKNGVRGNLAKPEDRRRLVDGHSFYVR